MFHWLQSAGKSLSNLVEESIIEEDANEKSKRAFHLTPLQSHLGVLKSKPKPLFHILPIELKLLIFSFIPPEDLITSVCCVCREWMKLANDDRSWELRFNREILYWNTYGFHPNFINNYSKKLNKYNYKNNNNFIPPGNLYVNEYDISKINKKCENEKKEYKHNSINNDNNNNNSSISMTWKEWYLQQYLHNSKLYHSPENALKRITSKDKKTKYSPNTSSINIFSIPIRIPGQSYRNQREPIFRIPIFGQAMNSSAGGLLYSLMWSQESPLLVTGLYAGTDGIGSGVGFKVNSKRLNLAAIYGKNPMDILYSKHFFEEADALIYVVDYLISDEDITLASEELNIALKINQNIPLMIFCCENLSYHGYDNDNNDIGEDNKENNNLILRKRSFLEFIKLFNIKNENNYRKWCIKHVKNVSDICKGLDWLSSVI